MNPSPAFSMAPKAGDFATLAIVALATALVMLVFTIPLTTLASTGAALGADAGQQAWILSAMPLGCAIGLLPGGAFADDYGRKRVFNAGLIVIGATLAASMLATSADMLIVLRLAHGIGGSAVLACGLGLIAHQFPDAARRGRATSTWTISLGASVASGPILAAFIDRWIGWHAAYGVTAAMTVLLALGGSVWLGESKAERPRKPDLAGTITLGAGMAGLLAGMTELRGSGLQLHLPRRG